MLDVENILGADGRIARRLSSYETREEQLEMARAVQSALRENTPLVVEAGTGVGKSFAYLVPALLAAMEPGNKPKRIVVSTNTISLQEQLISKDLPFLRSLWPEEFSAVLVKGRSNYISRRRLQVAQARASQTLFEEAAHQQLHRIAEWAASTRDGSRSDLDFPPIPVVWDLVQSEHGNCLGRACPEHEQCFYYAARRRVLVGESPRRESQFVFCRSGVETEGLWHSSGVSDFDPRRSPHLGRGGIVSLGPAGHQRTSRLLDESPLQRTDTERTFGRASVRRADL